MVKNLSIFKVFYGKIKVLLRSSGLPWAFIDAVENMGIINDLEMKLRNHQRNEFRRKRI